LFSLLVRYSARYRTPMAQCLLRNMLQLEWIAVAALGVAVVAVPLHFVIQRAVMRIVMLPVLAVVIGWVIYTRGQVQCAPPAVEQDGDEHWRWGLFYSNAADPALFIQARTGLGYTLNFGKVLAWPLAAAVFGYLVFLMLLGFHRI
jgi:uncharacterized membrane protein